MKKFILFLVLVFAFFYLGGLLMFDNGMSYEISRRVPEAVVIQKFALAANDFVGTVLFRLYVLARPAIDAFIKLIDPLLNPSI